ncbi:MAG: S-adenosyl-l-methionine hydroxide adenosyltransferase family protein, partial [Myxococcota bacterium]
MPSPSGLITLTTDFGDGWYVGAMKGAALSTSARVVLVDLTHGVPPMNILAGAFALAAGCDAFPDGTVHVAVVDPGVGTGRRAIAIETDRFLFVGPDNGVLTLAAPAARQRRAFLIREPRFFGPARSDTFHGRDIFSPVAA